MQTPQTATPEQWQRFAYRARTNSEIVALTFTLWLRNLATYLIIAVPVSLAVNLLVYPFQLELQRALLTSADPNVSTSALLVSLAVSAVQTILIFGLTTRVASEALHGRRIGIGEALNGIGSPLIAYAGAYLVAYLVAFGLGLVGGILSAFLIGIPIIGAALYVGVVMTFFLAPVFVLENTPFADGMRRAWTLGKSRFWSNLGLTLMIALIVGLISLLIGTLAPVLVGNVSVTADNWESTYFSAVLLSTLFNAIFIPLTPIALTLKYYDTRVRLEGIEVTLDILQRPNPRPGELPAPAPVGPWLDRADYTNVALLSLLFLLLTMFAFSMLMSGLGI
ncbi:MAG TPA: hypothetical protein PKX07_01340 [Aggregatilineales bacterium]|nr:hypothetical protein [Aggregatilineales bacterium]